MRVLLLNDTSNYHNGCKQVVHTIHKWLEPHTVVHSLPVAVPHITFDSWDDVDAVVCNGEGTMHNNRQGAISLLNFLKKAQQQNKPTLLINSIWQNMDSQWRSVTDNLVYWSVRDELSQTHAKIAHNRMPELCADHSWFEEIQSEPTDTHSITLGQSFDRTQLLPIHPHRIDIFSQSWSACVNQLRNSELLVSGRFHEVMASIRAGTPFLAIKGNSWKMEALISSAKSDLPILKQFPKDIKNANIFKIYKSEYQKIFNWHKQQTLPNIQSIL